MDDLFVKDLERKFGDSGYAFWFKTLELIAAHGKRGILEISWKNYSEKLNGKRRDHLQRLLTFSTQATRIRFADLGNDFIRIEVVNFLKYADNYTKYGDGLRSDFKETLKQEVEEEVDKKKKEIIPPTPLSKSFESFWGRYPNRQGRKNALRHFEASVKTEADVGNLGRALENYLRSGNVNSGFIKNGSTWFNEWQDWITPTETMMAGGAKGKPPTPIPKVKFWKCEDCGAEMSENKRESHIGPSCPKWKPMSMETKKELQGMLDTLKDKIRVT